MSPAKARILAAHSGVKRTNHEATVPSPVAALDLRLKVAIVGDFHNGNSAKNEKQARV